MDEPKLPISPPGPRIGAQPASPGVDADVDVAAGPIVPRSHMVFSGSEAEVREGLAIALRLMGGMPSQ
jgi:hypothetical protein